jgi:hypothetical protein
VLEDELYGIVQSAAGLGDRGLPLRGYRRRLRLYGARRESKQ